MPFLGFFKFISEGNQLGFCVAITWESQWDDSLRWLTKINVDLLARLLIPEILLATLIIPDILLARLMIPDILMATLIIPDVHVPCSTKCTCCFPTGSSIRFCCLSPICKKKQKGEEISEGQIIFSMDVPSDRFPFPLLFSTTISYYKLV